MLVAQHPRKVEAAVLLLSVFYGFACVLLLQFFVGALQDAILRHSKNFSHVFILPFVQISFVVADVAAFYHDYSCNSYEDLFISGVWRHVLPLPLTLQQGKRSRLIGIPVFAFIIAVVDAVLVFRNPTLKSESVVLTIMKGLLKLTLDLEVKTSGRHGESMLFRIGAIRSSNFFSEYIDTQEGSTTRLLPYLRLPIEVLLAAAVCASFALAQFFNKPQHDGDELCEATRSNNISEVKVLLARGVDPNACLGDGTTALHICGQQAMSRVAYVLLDHGADANVRDRLEFTPLHWAVQMRREERSTASRLSTIRILLHHGADPHLFDAGGTTPLSIASRKENEVSLGVLKDFLSVDGLGGEAESTEMIHEITSEINNNSD